VQPEIGVVRGRLKPKGAKIKAKSESESRDGVLGKGQPPPRHVKGLGEHQALPAGSWAKHWL